jgi:siroheme synthase-like protein
MMERLSVSLDLQGKLVLVVGGGKVASQRIQRMLRAGGAVTVVSPRLEAELSERVESDQNLKHLALTWAAFEQAESDERYAMVCACTDEPETNAAVAQFGESIGAFVNRADKGRASSLHFAAESQVGDVRVTVATGGSAPVVSRALREVLDEMILPHWASRAKEVAALRPAAKELPKPRRRRFWASLKKRLIEHEGDDAGFATFAGELLEKLRG